jgi:glucose-6-phosphate 1-epimerase
MPLAAALELQSADSARALVHPQGAHLASWRSADGEERLFLSSRSGYARGVAIRGGVPVIFPQFADLGPLPKHGFARTADWTLEYQHGGHARWALQADAATLAIWPRRFRCDLSIAFGGQDLRMELGVTNTGDQPLAFTAALHTYLRVADIDGVRLLGLQGLRYRDKTRSDMDFTEDQAALAITGEVDRIYLDAPAQVTMIEGDRRLLVEQQGFTDTVVWNPGADKGAALADMEEQGYRRMLCVEAAVAARPVQLAPGERWSGSQTLRA